MTGVGANLILIRKRIDAAARRAGRDPAAIRLLAVTKKVEPERIRAAFAAGQVLFGENYVQEARDKIAGIGPGPAWHLIGHLQTNKARLAAELFDVVETIDRPALALALDRHLGALGRTMRVLVQVNVGAESQKSGVMPAGAEALLREIAGCRNLRVAGLMAMPPYSEDPEASRPYFARLRGLGQELVRKGLLDRQSPLELSMGMSGDFEVAVEEGATLVRVGTALFGGRVS